MAGLRLLDLFCGAGGCSVGYKRAGFSEIVGADVKPQRNYPFEFVQADALDYLSSLPAGFDFIHASPPCQAYSAANHIRKNAGDHPDLVGAVRQALAGTGIPWVIENVPGAPLNRPVVLCGLALGLRVKRHRLFESSFPLPPPPACPRGHPGDWVTVFGGGAPRLLDNRRRASAPVAAAAMGIDWMARDELSQAVPPAYAEWIGRAFLAGRGVEIKKGG